MLLLTSLVPFAFAIGGLVIMKRRVLHARAEMVKRAGQSGGSGDAGYVSDTGGWSLSNWFGDFGSSGHDGCANSHSDGGSSGGGDCGGGDGGGGGH